MTPGHPGSSARQRPGRAVGVLLAAGAALGAMWLWKAREGPAVVRPAAAPPVAAAPQQAPAVGAAVPASDTATPAPAAPAAEQAAARRSATGIFESDASGRLVLDERMRLAVEALVSLNPAEAVPALVDAEVQGLPPAAAEAARELALRFDTYQQAQRAAFEPGQAPLVPEDGLAELDALVALRTSYFGADAARRMFGGDEAVTRRLLQLMAEDRATTLTIEQKAIRAQQRYDVERGAAPASR
jgi:hypothetical protein